MELALVLLSCLGLLACPWLIGRTRFISGVNPSVSPTRISVIVTAHNDGNNLRQLLPALYTRGKISTQVIVADMDSCDDSAAIARGLGCEVVSIHNTSSLFSKMRSKIIAAKKADSDILIFVDANVYVSKNALNRMLTALKSCDVVSVYPQARKQGFVQALTYIRHIGSFAVSGVFSFTPKRRPSVSPSVFAIKKETFLKIFSKEKIIPCLAEGMCFAAYFKSSRLKIRNYLGGEEIYCYSDKFFDNMAIHNGRRIFSSPIKLNTYSLAAFAVLILGGISIFINLIASLASSTNFMLWISFYILFAVLNFRYTAAVGSYPLYIYFLYPVCIAYFFVEASFAIKNRKTSARFKIKLRAKAKA